ncbi:MAG TPA: hypothetical protein VHB21_04415, partial [Minicystis sp.]|nr:hypothetical protein [Minicystis sp.]
AFGFNLGDGEGLGLQLYRPSDEAYVAATSSLYDDTVARLYVAKVRGGQLVVTVDGSTVATAASTATEQFIEGAPFQIGASSGTNCLNADVAELFVVNNPNADTDGLEAYLMAKYGL